MSISTHVLDVALGHPAAAVPVLLEQREGDRWLTITRAETDADGRCKALLPPGQTLAPGLYRIHFDTAAYYEQAGYEGLYPLVEITFLVRPGASHYHIPLLLTPNGYTTYRGS